MTNVLEIDGKLLYPIKDAAKEVSYSRDYISRLARDEKIIASYVGRQWYVDIDSLKQFVEVIGLEQVARKNQLSIERKRERELRETKQRQNTLHLKKAKTLHVKSVVTASLVLGLGLLGGFTTHQLISFSKTTGLQVASSHTAQSPQKQIEATGELGEMTKADDVAKLATSQVVQELRPIGEDVQNGILLFPGGVSSTTVEEIFSDTVLIKEMSDGTQAVVRVDEKGNTLGNAVPFVVVPIKHQEI